MITPHPTPLASPTPKPKTQNILTRDPPCAPPEPTTLPPSAPTIFPSLHTPHSPIHTPHRLPNCFFYHHRHRRQSRHQLASSYVRHGSCGGHNQVAGGIQHSVAGSARIQDSRAA
ncbi:hypothetical protein ACFX19_001456 [Malus domestica]